MGQDLSCQRLCLGLIPFAMTLEHLLRRTVVAMLQGEEHVAMGLMVIRLDRQGPFVAFHSLRDDPLVI